MPETATIIAACNTRAPKIDLRVIMIVECEMVRDVAQGLYDFIKPLLMYTPKLRATAQDCLSHPFLSRTDDVSAAETTESATVGSEDHTGGHKEREDARVEQGMGVAGGHEEQEGQQIRNHDPQTGNNFNGD
mgnify:CR=1 FL=1